MPLIYAFGGEKAPIESTSDQGRGAKSFDSTNEPILLMGWRGLILKAGITIDAGICGCCCIDNQIKEGELI